LIAQRLVHYTLVVPPACVANVLVDIIT